MKLTVFVKSRHQHLVVARSWPSQDVVPLAQELRALGSRLDFLIVVERLSVSALVLIHHLIKAELTQGIQSRCEEWVT